MDVAIPGLFIIVGIPVTQWEKILKIAKEGGRIAVETCRGKIEKISESLSVAQGGNKERQN